MTTVAFVGLGVMGGPMSENLAKAGFSLRTFDSKAPGNSRSLKAAASGADFLVTMLPDGRVVGEVLEEALPWLSRGVVVVDMSSSDPVGTRELGARLARKGVALVDAPVSGAVTGAREATLTIMAGGEKGSFEKARPLLEAMGKQIFHVGPLGAGHAVKALNNYLGAVGTLAGFEVFLIGKALGLDPVPMLGAINASIGRNSTTERKIPRDILTGTFNSGFKLALMTKDLGIAARLAKDLGLTTPFLEETLRTWRAATAALPDGADHVEIYTYQDALSRRRSSASRRKPAPSRAARARRSSSRRTRRRST